MELSFASFFVVGLKEALVLEASEILAAVQQIGKVDCVLTSEVLRTKTVKLNFPEKCSDIRKFRRFSAVQAPKTHLKYSSGKFLPEQVRL